MTETTKPTKNNNAFYAAIAGCLVGLFLMLFVPCLIAMFVARCREKRQERRDALAEEGDDDECDSDTDYLIYGPFPFDSAIYHVDEVGESSGYREPQDGVQELDSADQLTAQLTANQEEDAATLTAQQEEHYKNLDDVREPQYEGKGKAPMYAQLQTVLVEQQQQQLPENVQVELPGRPQEDLPEAAAQLQDEQKVVEEFQDAPEAVPAPAKEQQQLLIKEDQA
ncbi:hypothetical protein GGI43DRAFT_433399 [Trichoderma evansii]